MTTIKTLIKEKLSTKVVVLIICCFLLYIINWFCVSATPFLIGKFIDDVIQTKIGINIFYIYILIGLLVLDIVSNYISNILITRLTSKFTFHMSFSALQHLKKVKLEHFSQKNAAEISQQISMDSDHVSEFLISSVFQSVGSLLSLVLCVFFTFQVNTNLAIIILCFVPIYLAFYIVTRKKIFELSFEYSESQIKFFSDMNHQLSNIKIIKINAWYNTLNPKFKKSFQQLYETTMKYSKFAYLYNSVDKITNSILSIIIIIYGGYLLLHNQLSIGGFAIINSYVGMINGSVSYFFNFFKSYKDVSVSKERLENIFLLEKELNHQRPLKSIDTIAIENVSYQYPDATFPIVNSVHYTFSKGNIYLLQGGNGSGKSTFLNVMLGLHSDYNGHIKYNGVEMKELDLYHMREHLVSMVEQEPMLISDTILNNLTLGTQHDISDDVVHDYCKDFGLDYYIQSLPEQLHHHINHSSTNLSGGQKQKLSLIRCFLKEADLLILDEPTSALDIQAIINLKEYLLSIKQKKIIIIVSHDERLNEIADQTIQFNHAVLQNV
ncbi:ABC transporter transmembrane domain-containing protein [Priestia koreensis]|uniref:ABC transporter transmembrane domain-containing protein n=1 Tax=Priestia koreensis TaxID=284581 RepID=UPI00203A485F|nr:ABC transporter ATP-binding protein/permease [Priestia koreensis]